MKLYLAGIESYINAVFEEKPKYVLYSYINRNSGCLRYVKSKYCKSFILDSGAFTFMNTGKKVDFKEYAIQYAQYVKENNIANYIELDLYNIIGIEETEELRKILIDITGRKPIPVFHRSCGKEYFHKLINEFEYIAIGGIAKKDIKKSEYKYFDYFINEAHKKNVKIHGLGLTDVEALKRYKFDSVDSTSWIGGRFGIIHYYENGNIKMYRKKNSRLKSSAEATKFSLSQWVKFQEYADRYL